MPAIKKILVTTDLSERAARAEKRAAMLCAQHGVKTAELLTVKEVEQPETLAHLMNSSADAAREVIISGAMRELRARSNELADNFGIRLEGAVRFGQPAREIAAHGEEFAADLIVVGAHGANFLTDLFIGNTVDRLIRLSRRPVLVVKKEPLEDYRNILVPVDFSEDSRQAARLALRIGGPAKITLLHVYDVQFEGKMHYASVAQDAIDHYRLKAREDARLALNAFIDSLGETRQHLTRNLVFGLPGIAVLEFAEKMEPDLIVLGKHGRSGLEEMIMGSVTRDALEQTKADVLVVPPTA